MFLDIPWNVNPEIFSVGKFAIRWYGLYLPPHFSSVTSLWPGFLKRKKYRKKFLTG